MKHSIYPLDAIITKINNQADISQRQYLWLLTLFLWTGTLIATPISLWVSSLRVFPALATLGVLSQLLASLLALSWSWSIKRIALVFITVITFTWGLEAVGSRTGIPFGHYQYTSSLQPQLYGVPFLIPLAWMMMLPPAWAISEAILATRLKQNQNGYWFIFSLLSGAVFTAWDFYLDPQMVLHGLWFWENPNGYFGIPWLNFFGWWLSASLLTLLIRPRVSIRPPLMLIYTLTWAFQAVGLAVFWGQPGPALGGFLGMGFFTLWSWQAEVRSSLNGTIL